mmetsp:Transcript_9423/g.42913  ORF Transcript_9423/g.42913 Transcript_9423/m.42913 type:complete len:155 (-) Transcript_9423:360-824(-)
MAKEEASRKRKRASQAAKARLRDEDDETPEHLEFKGTLKKLKSPQLKDVCKANHLMVAGSKTDLLERIVGCHLHGHSWRCPDCGKSKMELVFDDPSDPKRPTALACKHVYFPHTRKCRHGSKEITAENKAELLPKKLVDFDGILASVGIFVEQQ